jgi:hypothetical protein
LRWKGLADSIRVRALYTTKSRMKSSLGKRSCDRSLRDKNNASRSSIRYV